MNVTETDARPAAVAELGAARRRGGDAGSVVEAGARDTAVGGAQIDQNAAAAEAARRRALAVVAPHRNAPVAKDIAAASGGVELKTHRSWPGQSDVPARVANAHRT